MSGVSESCCRFGPCPCHRGSLQYVFGASVTFELTSVDQGGTVDPKPMENGYTDVRGPLSGSGTRLHYMQNSALGADPWDLKLPNEQYPCCQPETEAQFVC